MIPFYARTRGVALSLFLCLFSVALSAQSPIYVDDSAIMGMNDGSSWGNAFTDLQSAIATASGDIWVAAGTYKPSAYPAGCTDCETNRDFTFQLKDGVSLYGGFAGTEDAISDRDIAANPTILSGDIGTLDNSSDNVHHVVLAAFADTNPTTRLDGFTITMGSANGSSNITVNGATIPRNRGGGISTSGGTNTLDNNNLSGNTATLFGGGICTEFSTNTLTNNSLSGNTASNSGGGIYTNGGTTRLTNNSLSGNTSSNGGGILFAGGTHILTNSIIWGNSSGILNGGSTLTVTYSIVQGGFTGEGNLDADPLFVNQPPQGLGTSGDLRLQVCSPAINAGNDAEVPMSITTDLDGNDRIFEGTVDMGAYELQVVPPNLYYVDAEATGSNTGLSWADAFTDLQSAIAISCVDIWVAAGTYKPSEIGRAHV